eukprot:2642060-Rhodomonas_salina.5
MECRGWAVDRLVQFLYGGKLRVASYAPSYAPATRCPGLTSSAHLVRALPLICLDLPRVSASAHTARCSVLMQPGWLRHPGPEPSHAVLSLRMRS